ncbi:MAG: 16S rRNA (adenine(1518)-N(6)/adenine(1519)-N(6))-dimethyltransferase RsmA [Methanomassiliicoccus sp.]|nr:16S rRNA (adenine(1518)-N(6)/adenine(1519)-N(6))-dimethyltransferase RsmA [Methanomassiliicoccus sp.]
MDHDVRSVTDQLARLGISPSKGLGQNFLIDERVADRQVAAAGISSDDTVLEIGPGLGVLTKRLAQRAGRVIAIEMDRKLAENLRPTLPDNVQLVVGDALEVPFPRFDRMVSNLPYSISSPIIFKLLDHDFRKAMVMLQKEFADRMVAAPDTDDYSRLTVNVYYRAECRLLEKVPRSRFWPPPKVDSAVVELVPRPSPFSVEDEKLFFRLVDLLFQQRRKKIGTVLKMKGLMTSEQRSSVPYVDDRVEALSPEQIGELSDAVADLRTDRADDRSSS